MITIKWSAKGLFAWVRRNTSQQMQQQMLVVARDAQTTAVTMYATGRTSPSIADRFLATAFGNYGFAKRSSQYGRRQMKILGAKLPYVSPRGQDFLKLALAISNVRTNKNKVHQLINAIKSLSAYRPHLRDLISIPGIGFSVTNGMSSRSVTTKLTFPAAKGVLNRGGYKTEIYRQQFADLSLGGARDAKAIARVRVELLKAGINTLWQKSPRIPIGGAAA